MSQHENSQSLKKSETAKTPINCISSDPALVTALKQLKQANTCYHAQVALNIIKVVAEHAMEDSAHCPAEWVEHPELFELNARHLEIQSRYWYDLHETLNAATSLLLETPEDLQAKVIPSVAFMIERCIEQASRQDETY